MKSYYEIKRELQEEIFKTLDMSRDFTDDDISEIIDGAIFIKGKEHYMSTVTKLTLKQDLFNSIRRLDLLQELLDDPEITEIMVNGPQDIFYEKQGRLYVWNKHFDSMEKLEDVIQQIVSRANRQVNESSPIVDARLSDGSRVNVVLRPVALNGPILTIRKFAQTPITIEQMIEWGSITREAAEYLKALVTAGYNIFISGGTGCGKTTFLNALANYIPKDERVVTVEDSAELQIQGIDNLVKLEVRNPDSEGDKAVTMRDLIKASLRMRPSRIVVGEVRGPEALDMINAMNTGHSGSISTGHANSCRDMLSRLETMVLMGAELPLGAISKQIASSIDIIVHLGRLRDKSRRVLEIVELLGCQKGEYQLNLLFQFEELSQEELREKNAAYGTDTEAEQVLGRLKATGNALCNQHKLAAANLTLPELEREETYG